MALTYGDLRRLIAAEKLGWQPRADRPDYVRLPLYSLGASDEGLVPTAKAPKFDLRSLGVSGNPFLAVRRAERGLISAEAVRDVYRPGCYVDSGLRRNRSKGGSLTP